MSLQRNDAWYEARRGRFTASEIKRILGTGRRDMTEDEMKEYKEREPKGRRKTIDCIGDGLYSYALENAVEELYGIDPEDKFVSWDMKRGIDNEPLAFKYFSEKLAVEEFLEVSEVGFVQYEEHAGCSSDGKINNNTNVEIKCPTRARYFKMVVGGVDELDGDWIDQVQFQMLCTDKKQTRFWLYYKQDDVEHGHEIIIDRDEERISFMKERLKIAIQEKKKFITQLLESRK